MIFEISPDIARAIDKIFFNMKTDSFTIEATNSFIVIQATMDDKSLLVDLKLSDDVFVSIEDNQKAYETIFSITKCSFYKPKVVQIFIEVTKYYFIIKWIYQKFIQISKIYIADGRMSSLNFTPTLKFSINTMQINQTLKHFKTKTVQLSIEDYDSLLIYSNERNLEVTVRIPIQGFNNFHDCETSQVESVNFDLLVQNLKSIFLPFDHNTEAIVFYQSKEDPINIIINYHSIKVSYYTAIIS